MRTSLTLLLIALAVAIGYGLAANRASAWYLMVDCFALLAALQIGYFIGAVTAAIE